MTPYVSDFADIIDAASEARITADLRKLRQSRGTEMAVVTIDSRAEYGNAQSLEAFSTALFNDWGIGSAEINDGILFLVSRDDREMRVELGAGYAPIFDDRMKTVIDGTIIPYFRRGEFSAGIEAGVLEIIKRTEFAFIEPPVVAEGWFSAHRTLLVFSAAAILIILLKFRHLWQRLRRCPNCGRRSLSVERIASKMPDADSTGIEDTTVCCGNCDYRQKSRRTLPAIRQISHSGGSFGGGRSGGGGASGRW